MRTSRLRALVAASALVAAPSLLGACGSDSAPTTPADDEMTTTTIDATSTTSDDGTDRDLTPTTGMDEETGSIEDGSNSGAGSMDDLDDTTEGGTDAGTNSGAGGGN